MYSEKLKKITLKKSNKRKNCSCFFLLYNFFFSHTFILSKKYLISKNPTILKFDVWEESSYERTKIRNLTPLIEKIFIPKKIIYVDIEALLVSQAKRLFKDKKFNFIIGDISKLPLISEIFDVVIDFSTTDHLAKRSFSKALKETYRILKKGGIFLIYHLNKEYFNIDEWNKYYKMNIIPSFPRNEKEVVNELKKVGFKILIKNYYFYPFIYDKTLRWFYFFSRHKFLFDVLPSLIKYRFFNSRTLNLFFFILAKK